MAVLMSVRPIHFLLLATLLVLTSRGTANAAVREEYQLKAAFLYNFAKFVSWPDRSFSTRESPIIIGVLGADPFGGELQKMVRNRKVNGRSIVVKQVVTADAATSTHLLFVSSEEVGRYAKIKHALDPAVLAVGESEAFAKHGGGITFKLQDNKLRFEINMAAADRGGLKVSAQLQKLATAIRR